MKFELVGGIVLIDAIINNIEGQMAFDSGAVKTTLNKKYFNDLSGSSSTVATYDSGMLDTLVVESEATIKIDSEKVFTQSVHILNFDYVENPLQEIKKDLKFLGALGIDIIGRENFVIDYIDKNISFLKLTSTNNNNVSIPIMMEKLPIVHLKIDHVIHRFVLDTGASHCVIDNDLLNVHKFNRNADGKFSIPEMNLGDLKLSNVDAVSNDLSVIKEKMNAEGIIGYDVFKDHTYYFDFDSEVLIQIK